MVVKISNCFACLTSLLPKVSQLTFLQTPADAWPPLIPVWLLVSGSLVVLAPAIYSVYDVFCKQEEAVNKGESGNIRYMHKMLQLTLYVAPACTESKWS